MALYCKTQVECSLSNGLVAVYFSPAGQDGVDLKTWDSSESASFAPLPPGEQLDMCRCIVDGSLWMKCYASRILCSWVIVEIFW